MTATTDVERSDARQVPFVAADETEKETHERAWAFLHKWQLAPRPHAYEVAYLYFEGGYEETINKPIDEAIAKSNGLCDYDIQQIHASLRGCMDAGLWQKLDSEFRNLTSIVERQASTNDTYSKNLIEKNEQISTVTTIEQFREVISGLVRDNERMLNETRGLRQELKRSGDQIDDLRSKLEESRDKELEDRSATPCCASSPS